MDSSGVLRHDRKSKRRSFTGGKTGNSGSVTCPVQEMVLRIITVKQLFDKSWTMVLWTLQENIGYEALD